MDTGIVSVAAVTAICYLIAQGVKATSLNKKWIPLICGSCGAALGHIGMFIIRDFPAADPLTATAVGIVSGLAATGSHQILKQLTGGQKDE